MRPTAVPAFAFALLLVPAAGCLSEDPPAPATAGQLRPQAQERAEAWNADARLQGVVGVEGNVSRLLASDALNDVPDLPGEDDALADGRAPAWAFAYRAGGNGFGVVVAKDGTVVDTWNRQPEGNAVDRWSVDSDNALQAARNVSEGDGRPVLVALVAGDVGSPFWAVVTNDSRERVDAVSGDHRGTFAGGTPIPLVDEADPAAQAHQCQAPPEAFTGSLDVTLDATQGNNATREIEVPSDCYDRLGLRLELEDPPAGQVDAILRTPDEPVNLTATPAEPTDRAAWTNPYEGNRTLELILTGARQAFTVSWCAPGSQGTPEAHPACPDASDGDSFSLQPDAKNVIR